MKCPKCAYLGFETGDRCKNCGYEFSLLSRAVSRRSIGGRAASDDEPGPRLFHDPDVDGAPPPDDEASIQVNADLSPSETPPIQREAGMGRERTDVAVSTWPKAQATRLPRQEGPPLSDLPLVPEPRVRFFDPASAASIRSDADQPELALPLFPLPATPDEPLIRLPLTPRPPLSVRRTLETPRLRSAPRPLARLPREQTPESRPPVEAAAPTASPAIAPEPLRNGADDANTTSRMSARLLAALVDNTILLGIDLAVVYLTVRLAGLSMSSWRLLPLVPLAAFLVLLKAAYFYAFTAVGGQTIGKMAVGARVVADDGSGVDASRAMRRTCAGLLSVLLLGLGFVPAFFGRRRTLHDKLAGTRVVRLKSA